MEQDTFTIHTDGGARGNPGPAAIGVVVEKNNNLIYQLGKTIGDTTNNVAEYTAVVEALLYIKHVKIEKQTKINFILDSMLVVNQLNGLFKIKEPKLRELVMKIRVLESETGGIITYRAVSRELNKLADLLVNKALDGEI